MTMGFDPLLNQRQLPPAFPRYPRLRALPATLDELAALLDRLIRLRSVLECKHLHALIVSGGEKLVTYYPGNMSGLGWLRCESCCGETLMIGV